MEWGHDKFGEMNMKEIQYDELFQFDMKEPRFSCLNWIFSVDLHPTKPWILTSWNTGFVEIWNHRLKTMSMSFKASQFGPISSAKFVARKHWVVAGGEDTFIYVYNYNTMAKIKEFVAHRGDIRCVAVHPTLPYVLSSSRDMLIKLWDWDKGWVCTQIFEGHSNTVMQVTFNPKDTTIFASASLDRTIKIWNLGSPNPNFTLDAHNKGVNCVEYCTDGDKPYLISGSDDHTAKVWDYQTKSCVQILEGHSDIVSTASFHPDLPIIITGSKDGTVRVWNSTTYRLENTQNYGIKVGPIGYMKGSSRAAIVCLVRVIVVKLGRGMPVASMVNSGKIIWAEHYKIQAADIRHVGADYEVIDGARLPLAVQRLSPCDLYPQYLKHNPNGSLVVVGGDGEYVIVTSEAWEFRSHIYGLEFVWSSGGEYAVRESTSEIKIFYKNFREKWIIEPTYSAECIYGGTLLAICSNNFVCFHDWAECQLIHRVDVNVKNLYWADSGDLVAITSDTSYFILKYNPDTVSRYFGGAFELLHKSNELVRTGIWAGNCFVYTNSSWSLNCCFGGKVITMFYLDRPMYLLGYLAAQSHFYLIDEEFNVIGRTLPLSLIEYKSLVMCGDFERANALLPNIPKKHCDRR